MLTNTKNTKAHKELFYCVNNFMEITPLIEQIKAKMPIINKKCIREICRFSKYCSFYGDGRLFLEFDNFIKFNSIKIRLKSLYHAI